MRAFGGGSFPSASFGEPGYVNKIPMPDVVPPITERPKTRPPIGTVSTGPQID